MYSLIMIFGDDAWKLQTKLFLSEALFFNLEKKLKEGKDKREAESHN
jgi:hypothetical protein